MLSNRLTGLLVAGIAALFVAIALPGTGVQAQSPTATPAPAACPTGINLIVNAPSQNAPSTVSVIVPPGVTLKPATDNDRNSFHLHYFIDTAATDAGAMVPLNNPKIIHTASTNVNLGALSVGSHTVTVVLGQVNHVACSARGTVTFNLAQATTATPTPAATATPKATATATPKATTAPTSPTAAPKATTAPAAPKSGTGGYLGEQSSRWGIAIVLAVAALGAAGAGRIVASRKQ